MPLPPVGSPAPDFTLPSTSGQTVTLSALRGRNVLLAFFPLAFTSTCTAELCAMSDDYAQFERGNTVVLPISVDSVPTLRAFKAQEKMTVDLLSNRAYVLVDPAGTVRWAYQEANNSERRENAELLAQMAALG